MGWTVAEGDRFSGSTPHPRDHPPSGPASVVTSTRLRGFFWCRGGVESTSRRHAATAGGNSGACSAPYGFQFIEGRRAVAPGRAGNARGDHRAPPRRPLMGEGGRPAQRHRAPHPHRRPVDAAGRPPGPPGARTRPRRRGSVDRGLLPCRTVECMDMEAISRHRGNGWASRRRRSLNSAYGPMMRATCGQECGNRWRRRSPAAGASV